MKDQGPFVDSDGNYISLEFDPTWSPEEMLAALGRSQDELRKEIAAIRAQLAAQPRLLIRDTSGISTQETWLFRGVTYHRHIWPNRQPGLLTTRNEDLEGDAHGVVCPCGSTSFSLRYGNCEIRARCDKCGLEDVVYDG